MDIADTRGETRGCPATLADTADVGDIGIGTQRSRGIITSYVKVIRVGDQDQDPSSIFSFILSFHFYHKYRSFATEKLFSATKSLFLYLFKEVG